MAPQDTTNKPASQLSAHETERILVAEILHHLGHLLIAKSPIKSEAQRQCQMYRGQLLTRLDSDQRVPFLQTREIVLELATLLAKSEDRAMLGRTLAYLKSLSQGEVMIVADDTADSAMRQRLHRYLDQECGFIALDTDLTEIINIVLNLNPQTDEAQTH